MYSEEFSTFDKSICAGGDERIELLENGLNKYFVNPVSGLKYFNRGSCTANVLTDQARVHVESLYNDLMTGKKDFQDVRTDQAEALKTILGKDVEYEVFMAPSGSDLCYYSLLFANLLKPNKPIYNIVTCPEELGTGSLTANSGEYFGTKTQILDHVEKGKKLSADLKVVTESFPARNSDGEVLDHTQKIKESIERNKDQFTIMVNLVVGSKSGIEDNINIIDELADEDIIWVVDLCQLRASKTLIKELIEKKCFVLTTGSKFYQAPPFCGAMILPEVFVERMIDVDPPKNMGFETIFAKYDIPEKFEKIRSLFEDYKNIGQTLRWESAIFEMKVLDSKFSPTEVIKAVSKWNQAMLEEIESRPNFELMDGPDSGNRSLIAVRLKDDQGRYLTHDELRSVFKAITLAEFDCFGIHKKVLLGQPVAYSGQKSFLRFALGSYNVRMLLENDFNFEYDMKLIQVVEDEMKRQFA